MLYSPFSDSMITWLSRDRVTAVLAANVQFESGTAYVHSGTGTLVLGGFVYYGMGTLGAIDDVSETNTTSPTQLKMTLSGLDMSLFAKTLNERCVGKPAELYLVAMDDNGVVQVADLIFKGRVSGTGATSGDTNALIFLRTGSDLSRIAIPMNPTRQPSRATVYFATSLKWQNVQFTGAVKKMRQDLPIREEA